MTITAPEFISKWVGTPHSYDGRGTSGTDCWGLVRAYYDEVEGMELPDWKRADHSRAWVMALMTGELMDRLEYIDEPVDGCIAIAERKGGAHHMGIYFNHGIFHVCENGRAAWRPLYIAEAEFGGTIRYGRPKNG
jgi:cell wall-associated NlpC family hydrolase